MLAFVKNMFGIRAAQKSVALPVKSDIKAGRRGRGRGKDDGPNHDAGHGPNHK